MRLQLRALLRGWLWLASQAAFSDPGNRRARLFTAAGSAGETRHAVRQAIAWRTVPASDAEAALALVKRIVAILWKMTR